MHEYSQCDWMHETWRAGSDASGTWTETFLWGLIMKRLTDAVCTISLAQVLQFRSVRWTRLVCFYDVYIVSWLPAYKGKLYIIASSPYVTQCEHLAVVVSCFVLQQTFFCRQYRDVTYLLFCCAVVGSARVLTWLWHRKDSVLCGHTATFVAPLRVL